MKLSKKIPWLSMSGLRLTYESVRGDFTALDGLELSISEGEFVSVLGPSGCGKSTLLKLASGLLLPSAGEVRIGGEIVDGPRRDVGMVFQQATLLPWNTVLDNVLVPMEILHRRDAAAIERAKELLDMVGLTEFQHNYPGELSGGMQQRVGIARSLIHDPRILLMDEPFAALDALTRETMMLQLQSIWQKTGKTVLFITHSIQEAAFLADRTLVMSQGPGRIIHEEEVKLSRPRDLSNFQDPDFAKICNRLRSYI